MFVPGVQPRICDPAQPGRKDNAVGPGACMAVSSPRKSPFERMQCSLLAIHMLLLVGIVPQKIISVSGLHKHAIAVAVSIYRRMAMQSAFEGVSTTHAQFLSIAMQCHPISKFASLQTAQVQCCQRLRCNFISLTKDHHLHSACKSWSIHRFDKASCLRLSKNRTARHCQLISRI